MTGTTLIMYIALLYRVCLVILPGGLGGVKVNHILLYWSKGVRMKLVLLKAFSSQENGGN
jgi:hypothetical protein